MHPSSIFRKSQASNCFLTVFSTVRKYLLTKRVPTLSNYWRFSPSVSSAGLNREPNPKKIGSSMLIKGYSTTGFRLQPAWSIKKAWQSQQDNRVHFLFSDIKGTQENSRKPRQRIQSFRFDRNAFWKPMWPKALLENAADSSSLSTIWSCNNPSTALPWEFIRFWLRLSY